MEYIFLSLAAMVQWWAYKVKFVAVSLAASAFTLAFTTYMFLGLTTPVDASTTYGGFLLGGLLLMVFVPLLFQMRTTIKEEQKNRSQPGMGTGGMTQGEFSEITSVTEKENWMWNKGKPATSAERQAAYKASLRSKRRK